MQTLLSYIDGAWMRPQGPALAVHNPANENVVAQVVLGTAADTDLAVAAARHAFSSYSQSRFEERTAYVEALRDGYAKRMQELADAMRIEMGVPATLALDGQASSGLAHFDTHLQAAKEYAFEYHINNSRIVHEPIGVAALITPWNWPMNQLVVKVIPALLSGCTMVVKPSEISPLSAQIFAEIVHEAGLPAGVFNLLHGDGAGVGASLSAHPGVDMVSFTGSARAGTAITIAAAPTIKRVCLELGGKSPNLILDDADLQDAVQKGVQYCMNNSGQNCDAPTRMYVPRARYEEALDIAKQTALALKVGDPSLSDTQMGPLVSQAQYDRVQAMIQMGIDEGAVPICGGTGKPKGLERGYFAKPTVFGHVSQSMRIAREEVFGPVLCILPYDDEEQLISMANDSDYGLSAYIASTNMERACRIARRLRTGQVQINYPEWDLQAPFGGYKQSGNGREYAKWGLHDFLETKAIVGHAR